MTRHAQPSSQTSRTVYRRNTNTTYLRYHYYDTSKMYPTRAVQTFTLILLSFACLGTSADGAPFDLSGLTNVLNSHCISCTYRLPTGECSRRKPQRGVLRAQRMPRGEHCQNTHPRARNNLSTSPGERLRCCREDFRRSAVRRSVFGSPRRGGRAGGSPLSMPPSRPVDDHDSNSHIYTYTSRLSRGTAARTAIRYHASLCIHN